MRKPRSFDSIEDALAETARTYRRNLWRDAFETVEVWCEKDALAGVIFPVTAHYDVPLMVTRGYSSETFAYEAITQHADDVRDYHVYYLGDFDRSGRDAAKSLEEKLHRFAGDHAFRVIFETIAINGPGQIVEHGLSTRPQSGRAAPTRTGRTTSPASWTRSIPTPCDRWSRDAIELPAAPGARRPEGGRGKRARGAQGGIFGGSNF